MLTRFLQCAKQSDELKDIRHSTKHKSGAFVLCSVLSIFSVSIILCSRCITDSNNNLTNCTSLQKMRMDGCSKPTWRLVHKGSRCMRPCKGHGHFTSCHMDIQWACATVGSTQLQNQTTFVHVMYIWLHVDLLHLRLRECWGRGCRKIEIARGPGNLLWDCISQKWQGNYTHDTLVS